jgi:hypothetical protein
VVSRLEMVKQMMFSMNFLEELGFQHTLNWQPYL